MARKKQEIALQTEIETQEEWEEMLTKEGLVGEFLFLCTFIHSSIYCALAKQLLVMFGNKIFGLPSHVCKIVSF